MIFEECHKHVIFVVDRIVGIITIDAASHDSFVQEIAFFCENEKF